MHTTHTYIHTHALLLNTQHPRQNKTNAVAGIVLCPNIVDTVAPIINGTKKTCWQNMKDADYFLRNKRVRCPFPTF